MVSRRDIYERRIKTIESELAKFIEVSPNALTQFEQGKRDISLGSLLVISYLFNIPLQELVAQ